MQQLSEVSFRRGAPMGRSGFGEPDAKRIRLVRMQVIDGDYDAGGAYWGFGRGTDPIYIACDAQLGQALDDGEYFATVRARSRNHAVCLLSLDPAQLAKPMDRLKGEPIVVWPYQIQPEGTGKVEHEWVVRDCRIRDDGYPRFIEGFLNLQEATKFIGSLLRDEA